MLKFRDLPEATDSQLGIPPPKTWPTPAPLMTLPPGGKDVESAVTADWKPWWNQVKPNYPTTLKSCPIGIRSIAHALHLELNNGWSFDFCLRFCEENLIETASGLSAAPTVKKLTTRGRAMVDETIASAIAIALAGVDGYRFLGDLGRYVTKYPGMVGRRWQGNGPDHIVAKMGKPTDGYVAEYLFLEAKGVAGEIPGKAPRGFYAHKTQSLNAELLFGCTYKPILSYVYLPVSTPQVPLVAQWFNAPTLETENIRPESKPMQAMLLLRIASDQFRRILRKSRLQGDLTLATNADKLKDWNARRGIDGKLWYVSSDGFYAITIHHRAPEFFVELDAKLDALQTTLDTATFKDSTEGQPIQWDGESQLLAIVDELRQLSSGAGTLDNEFESVGDERFEVIAEDATGITFLRRALG